MEVSSPRRRRSLVAIKSNSKTSDLGVSTSAEGLARDTSYAGLVTEAGEVVDALDCFVDLEVVSNLIQTGADQS